MKNYNPLAVAVAVAVSTLSLASCTKQEQPTQLSTPNGEARLSTSYTMVESNSMVTKANANHAAIVDAIAALNPAALPMVATLSGSKDYTEFKTGEDVTLKYQSYTFATTFTPEGLAYLTSTGTTQGAAQPFLSVTSSATITESSTELVFPAVYDCYAVVVPAAQCKGMKINYNGWTDLPSVVSGDYRIAFLKGEFGNADFILCVPTSEDYLQKQITAPKTNVSKGKYFLVQMQAAGATLPTSATFDDWADGWF